MTNLTAFNRHFKDFLLSFGFSNVEKLAYLRQPSSGRNEYIYFRKRKSLSQQVVSPYVSIRYPELNPLTDYDDFKQYISFWQPLDYLVDRGFREYDLDDENTIPHLEVVILKYALPFFQKHSSLEVIFQELKDGERFTLDDLGLPIAKAALTARYGNPEDAIKQLTELHDSYPVFPPKYRYPLKHVIDNIKRVYSIQQES